MLSRASCKFLLFSLSVFLSGTHANTARRSEPDATSQACAARVPTVPRTPAATERHAQDKVGPDRNPMLSLVGISGAALVMMSCKPPLAVPLRPMGKGLLRVIRQRRTGQLYCSTKQATQHRQHRRAGFLWAMLWWAEAGSPPPPLLGTQQTAAARAPRA